MEPGGIIISCVCRLVHLVRLFINIRPPIALGGIWAIKPQWHSGRRQKMSGEICAMAYSAYRRIQCHRPTIIGQAEVAFSNHCLVKEVAALDSKAVA